MAGKVNGLESMVSRRDYISPNLQPVKPDSAFAHMIAGDCGACPFPYLRRHIPHHWYVDRRSPGVGFLSRDEAVLLHNIALPMRGLPALEIGCWLGWSACHLALAGVQLDVVDPLLTQNDFRAAVTESLSAAGVMERVNLVAGSSPQAVLDLARKNNRKWNLMFIDGHHGHPAPFQDALTCEPLAANDAIVIFHDLARPDVGVGFDHFLTRPGWKLRIYQTMQIMGVAWRGNVEPPLHVPDPAVAWEVPAHLAKYPAG
jgi:hypothetical protein